VVLPLGPFPRRTAWLLAIAFAALSGVAAHGDPLPRNWPLAPSELERRLQYDRFRVLHSEPAGERTDALKLDLVFADGEKLEVKWKAAAGDLDQWNNSPRRELASYQMQRFFLDEHDYVVPTAAMRCVPVDVLGGAVDPTIEDTRCVLGVLSAWLRDVTAPYPFYDETRYARDPLYARRLEDFNLLTYLIDHRDGAQANLLLSTNASDPRSFSVDNGISFESFPWNMSVFNWYRIRVPRLRRQSVERLRSVDEKSLASLGVVAELALDEHGIFVAVPPGKNLGPRRGVRREDGRIQFGLTKLEISKVRRRIETVTRAADEAGRAGR
jgi:hypothetical protein